MTYQTRYVGRGRPGTNRPTQTIETHTWTVEVLRQTAAIDLFQPLGRMAESTSPMPPPPGSVWTGQLNCIVRNGNPSMASSLKGGLLAIMPLYLHDDERIRGLLLLLGDRVAGVDPDRIRCPPDLPHGEKLAGLYAGNPKHATDQPSAERLLKAFDNITLLLSTKQKPNSV